MWGGLVARSRLMGLFVVVGVVCALSACSSSRPKPSPPVSIATPPAEAPAAPTPPAPPPVAVAEVVPEAFESASFIVTFARQGDTAADLAARYLGDIAKAWMVEDYNGGATFEPGHEVVIPKRPWNVSGVGPTGYQIVPILVYHNLGPQSKGRLTIGVATFEEQMRYLKTHGYRVISLNEFLEFASLRR